MTLYSVRIMQRLLLRTIREQNIHNLCKFPTICCHVLGSQTKLCIFYEKIANVCLLGSFSSPFFFFILHRVRVLQVIYFQTSFFIVMLKETVAGRQNLDTNFRRIMIKKAISSENKQPVPKARAIRKGPRTYYYCTIARFYITIIEQRNSHSSAH